MRNLKLYEDFNGPTGDFVKYNYNDNPDVEEYVNKAASAMGDMPTNLYWFYVADPDTANIKNVIKDITGSANFPMDEVFTHDGHKLYVTGDDDAYYIVANSNLSKAVKESINEKADIRMVLPTMVQVSNNSMVTRAVAEAITSKLDDKELREFQEWLKLVQMAQTKKSRWPIGPHNS